MKRKRETKEKGDCKTVQEVRVSRFLGPAERILFDGLFETRRAAEIALRKWAAAWIRDRRDRGLEKVADRLDDIDVAMDDWLNEIIMSAGVSVSVSERTLYGEASARAMFHSKGDAR